MITLLVILLSADIPFMPGVSVSVVARIFLLELV